MVVFWGVRVLECVQRINPDSTGPVLSVYPFVRDVEERSNGAQRKIIPRLVQGVV